MSHLSLTFPRISPNGYGKGRPLSTHQWRRLQLIHRLLQGCSGKTLDYGCGFGDVAWAISFNREILAVDVDCQRVAFANSEYHPLKFEQCAEEGLHFADHEFQTVLSSVVIHWVDDQDRYLQEIARVLKPHGHLVFIAQNQPVIGNRLRYLRGKLPKSQPFWNESFEELQARIQRHGFEIEAIDCFYESPLDSITSLKEAALATLSLPFRLMNVPQFAHYYGFRVRKVALANFENGTDHDGETREILEVLGKIQDLQSELEALTSRKKARTASSQRPSVESEIVG